MDMMDVEKPKKKMKNRMDMMDVEKPKKNDDDRLSELPDEVIVQVLSFLPLRAAAATSLLSRRWIHLWKQLPNLNFDDLGRNYTQLFHLFLRPHLNYYSISTQKYDRSQLCMRKYIDWVNSVIEAYDKSHYSFPLHEFSIVVLVDKPNQHHVTKWLEFAFSRRVETLKLISNECWFSAGALADMLKGMSIPQDSNACFNSVKVLWLESFKMSSEAIEFLLRCCPMLETVVLDRLRVTTDLQVVGSSIKHLDIRCTRYSAKSLKIRAPDLTWLTINHHPMVVSLENVPKLVNMTIYNYSNMHAVHDFARVARQLETLIIFLANPNVQFPVPEMPNLKKLVVYYRYRWSKLDLFPATCFMQAAPALEDFRIEVGELAVDREVFRIPEDQGHEHRHLRRFVLSGFCGGCWDRIQLLRYMVKYCTALEEIVIGGQCNREGLVRDFVDYCVPLHHIIPPKPPIYMDYVATPQERQEINKRVRLFTPPLIKLRVL